ncbi:MAG: hypothetical protein H0W01_06155 [Pseudonocardiales bacterium]|nr:hypothetical protein [Pseudonocardiales bacterium]
MSRWAEWWSAASGGVASDDAPHRGARLGLPQDGPGASAGLGRRAAALVLDIVLAALVAGLFTAPELPRNWSLLAWFVLTVIPVAAFGASTGMTMLGMKVLRVDGAQFVGVPRALLRTALVFLVVPAVIWDADGRGLHDRATGTVAVRSR